MQWPLWACEPPAEDDTNTGTGQTPLYQWPLWACEPPAEDDTNTGTRQTPLYAVALVGL